MSSRARCSPRSKFNGFPEFYQLQVLTLNRVTFIKDTSSRKVIHLPRPLASVNNIKKMQLSGISRAVTLIVLSIGAISQSLPVKQEGGGVSKPANSRVRLVWRDDMILNAMRTILYVTDLPGILAMFCDDFFSLFVGPERASSVCRLYDDISIMIRIGYEVKGITVGFIPLEVLSTASIFSLYVVCKIEADSIPPDTRESVCILVRHLIFTFDNAFNVNTLLDHFNNLMILFA